MNRRSFLKITAVSGTLLAGGGVLAFGYRRGQPEKVQETRLLMGTIINMTVLAASRADGRTAISQTFDEMERLVTMFDHRQAQGALGVLNQQGWLAQSPPELIEIMERSLAFCRLSDGAFDVTVQPAVTALAAGVDASEALARVDYRQVGLDGNNIRFGLPGMAITLDGIAKGAVVDGAVATLDKLGFNQVLVEAGGDLRAGGTQQAWRIGVRHPRPEIEREYMVAFDLTERSAATSGDYMNAFSPDRAVHHIIDPRLGLSPSELASSTVIAPTATDADALSTSLMVLGVEAGLALVDNLDGVEALLVTKDLIVQRTAGFPATDLAV